MGNTILKIIPIDTVFIPDDAHQQEALRFLKDHFGKDNVQIKTTEETQFIDQGGNFDDVRCNLCKELISTEDWQQAMDVSYETRFFDLNFVTTCCQQITSLNDLLYNMPAGFSKFSIVIEDPDQELTQEEIVDLEITLRTSLRFIYARY